jgi:hypothetical protein
MSPGARRDPAGDQSKWNTPRSDALTGLWSGLDGMTSPMCFHHLWQASVAATANETLLGIKALRLKTA